VYKGTNINTTPKKKRCDHGSRIGRRALTARSFKRALKLWGKIWYGVLYRNCIAVLDTLGIKKAIRGWIKGPKN
jgi:hypothetical protein